jgi:predicted dienelactone hydrolase
MRFFEILIVIGLALRLIGYAWPLSPRPKAFAYITGLVLLACLLHLALEKWRWQMAPAYALLLLLCLLEIAAWLPQPTPTGRATWFKLVSSLTKWIGLHLAWLALLLASLLSLVAPVFEIPEPTGPFAVGTKDLYFLDASRPERFTTDPTDHRELLVRVWYPAAPSKRASVQPYWPGLERSGPLLLKQIGLPTFLLEYQTLIPSHSYPNAPLAQAAPKYPVLIFSHGYTDDLSSQLTLMEDLASHGYFVFGISHPYEALTTVFPDGRILLVEPRVFLSPFLSQPQSRQVNLNDQVEVWSEDTRFVLDQLEAFNVGRHHTFFIGRLDLENIGVFGMSFGGATATEVCFRDQRCRAGANLDGSTFGYVDYRSAHLKTPFLFFYNEFSEGMNDRVYDGVENWAYRVTIAGTTHANFTDKGLWSPYLKYASKFINYYSGPIEARRMIELKRAYLLAFFDRHLKGLPAPLLESSNPAFPEVDYQFRAP